MTGAVAPAHICVVYHSRRGTMYRLARQFAATARAEGMSVRLRRVPDQPATGPDAEQSAVPLVSQDDLRWADGLALGTPTFYGNMSWEFKRFVEWTSPLWHEGALHRLVVTGLTSSNCVHGGQEATLLSLYQSVYHWGSLVAPTGPFGAPGPANPHGVSRRVEDPPSAPDEPLVRGAVTRLGALAGLLRDGGRQDGVGPPPRVLVVSDGAGFVTDAVAEGAAAAGADVRVCDVTERAAILARELGSADGVAFGCRAELGTISRSLHRALTTLAEPRWGAVLDGTPVTGFVTAPAVHAGSETALLSLYRAMHHLGAVVMPNGTDIPVLVAAGGNPYGTSWVPGGTTPVDAVREAAMAQCRRLADVAARLRHAPPHPQQLTETKAGVPSWSSSSSIPSRNVLSRSNSS